MLVFLCWGAATSKAQAPISCLNILQSVNVATASEGDIVKYEITVCNTCNVAANNIAVSAVLPRGLLFQTATNLNYANQTVSNTVNLAGNSCQTFKYEILVLLATCTNNQTINNRARLNYNNQVRNSPNSGFNLVDNSIPNCQPANVSYTLTQAIQCGLLLPAAQAVNTSQSAILGGNLIIDQNYTFLAALNMKAGSQINVLNSVKLDIISSDIGAACQNCMWRGFILESKANVTVGGLGGSEISAAQYAFELKSDAQLALNGVDFRANFVGVYMPPLNNPILQAPQRLNLKIGGIRTSGNNMPKPFLGISSTPVQRTTPLGGLLSNPAPALPIETKQALACVYVSDAEILDVRVQNPAPTFNQYFEMGEGIGGIVAIRVGKVLANSNLYFNINEDAAYNTSGNIAWQGVGLYAQGIAGSTAYNVDVTNTAAFLTHDRCDNGIVGRSVNMIIRGQNMQRIQKAGITSRLATNCTVILESNQINSKTTGIDLLYNDPAAKIEAKGNSISVTPASSFIGTTSAIRILEGGNAYNNLDIQNNTLVCNNARAQVGLLVNGHSGGKIFNNDVYLQGNGNSPFFPNSIRTAMGFQNTNTNIDCNTVNPSGTGINSGNNTRIQNIMAINISGASGGRLSCNTVDKTFGGLRFENANTMLVQGNVLQNHTYGLWFTPNAVLNPQNFTGNRFIGTNIPNNGFEAYNQNVNLIIPPFRASSTIPDLIPIPQGGTGINLFAPPTGNSDFNCNVISPIWAGCGLEVFRLAALDDKDRAVANGSYAATNQVDMFENKKQLYRKLRRHNYLLQNEPTMQQFDNTESQTNIGAFDWVNTETATVLRLDSLDSLQLQNLQNQAQTLLDSMALLDSLQVWAAANNATQRDNLSAQWLTLQQQQNTFCQNKKMQQVQAIDAQLLPANQAIPVIFDHETAEKLVNEIYLQTLAKGVDVYNSSQEQTLQLISAQCPDILGTVVYKARAMYALAAYVDMFDKSACANTNNLEAQPTNVTETIAENGVILYPNPARTEITLYTKDILTTNTKITVYNSLGQIVKMQLISNETNTLLVDVQTLPNGIYTIQVSSENNPIVKQFIIVR
jgi:uncharacterized repeat protein (TIGR01451 family)